MALRNGKKADAIDVDPGDVTLQARNVKFDWSRTPLHWIPGEPIASHTLSAINLILPEGERWFCATFTEALPLINDDRLRADVRGFIGQEAMHAETHNVVLYEFLDAHDVDPRPFVLQSEYLMRKVLGRREMGSDRAQRQQLVERLAFIGAIEHMTAFLGDWILNARLEDFDADPAMTDLYRWHGAEEVEHRNVAHDVAMYFGVGYVRRNLAMLVSYLAFLVVMTRGLKFIVHADPTMRDRGYFSLWMGLLAAMRRGSLPGLSSLFRGALRYLDPRYSPQAEGDTAQAIAYLAKSPAARAAA